MSEFLDLFKFVRPEEFATGHKKSSEQEWAFGPDIVCGMEGRIEQVDKRIETFEDFVKQVVDCSIVKKTGFEGVKGAGANGLFIIGRGERGAAARWLGLFCCGVENSAEEGRVALVLVDEFHGRKGLVAVLLLVVVLFVDGDGARTGREGVLLGTVVRLHGGQLVGGKVGGGCAVGLF